MVMIADWAAKFTKSLGLELNASRYQMGTRCRRFCVLVENSTIVWFGLEKDAFVDSLGLILRHLGYISDSDLDEIVNVWSKICRRTSKRSAACSRTSMSQRAELASQDVLALNASYTDGLEVEEGASLHSIGDDRDGQDFEATGLAAAADETMTTETDITVEDDDQQQQQPAAERTFLSNDLAIKPVDVVI